MTNADLDEGPDAQLEALLAFVRDSRGFDFTGYKRSTLARRVHKRMHDVGVSEYADYQDHLESSADEFRFLFNTILINVTSFFRDAETWVYLQREVVPEILLSHDDDDEEIRVWSAGCSSGEEAYSLAIVFAEALGVDECAKRVKIYGTDIDEEALRHARAGLYPPRALEPLSKQLQATYFEANGGKLAFRPDLRRRVIFGRHDLTRDAPISRLDLLVCRNTMMYFNVEAQSQIVDRFHFALRDGGYLFLGKAEMLLSAGRRFEASSMRQRIFQRQAGESETARQSSPIRLDVGGGPQTPDAGRLWQLRDLVLETSPNAVIGIDLDGTLILANAQARAQLGVASHDLGRPLRDLEVSHRPVELRPLIEQAHAERRVVRVNSVERRIGADDVQYLDLLVQPLWSNDGLVLGVAVVFVDTTLSARLQNEVKRNREDLETAYGELQSTNEELETTNEELQSTNEELETTNEELQSGNEELETTNEELRIRTAELDEARVFLESVLGGVGAGVVVLDRELRVRSWNRGAEELWGLRADEVHRQLFFSLDFGLPTGGLRGAVEACVDGGIRVGPTVLDAVNRKGRAIVCAVTCTPLDGNRDGVVLWMEETGARQQT